MRWDGEPAAAPWGERGAGFGVLGEERADQKTGDAPLSSDEGGDVNIGFISSEERLSHLSTSLSCSSAD